MRTTLLIAAAGLTGLAALTSPARAQYYGWGYYRPYYPVPYGYYPGPYYPEPPVYDAPPPLRPYRRHVAIRVQHRIVMRPRRVIHRVLMNPLLGPLPGAPSVRRN